MCKKIKPSDCVFFLLMKFSTPMLAFLPGDKFSPENAQLSDQPNKKNSILSLVPKEWPKEYKKSAPIFLELLSTKKFHPFGYVFMYNFPFFCILLFKL